MLCRKLFQFNLRPPKETIKEHLLKFSLPVFPGKAVQNQGYTNPASYRDQGYYEMTPRGPKCHICGQIVNNINRHIGLHTGTNKVTCKVCGKVFSRSDSLRRHMMTHIQR